MPENVVLGFCHDNGCFFATQEVPEGTICVAVDDEYLTVEFEWSPMGFFQGDPVFL